MLTLTVHDGEYITIGSDIVVQVLKAGDTFRLAIDAPRELDIVRAKVRERTDEAPDCIQRVRKRKPPKYAYKKPDFKRTAE